MRRDEHDLEALVERTYGVAAGDESWDGLLDAITHSWDATGSGVLFYDLTGRRSETVAVTGIPLETARLYTEAYKDKSLLFNDFLHRPAHDVYTDTLYPDYRRYLASEAYQEYFRRFGMDHLMQIALHKTSEAATVLLVRRPADAGPYCDDETRAFARLAPHLRRGFRIHRDRLNRDAQVTRTRTVLDSTGHGFIMVDGRMRILDMNTMAKRCIDGATGLRVRHGRLTASGTDQNARLRKAVADAAAAGRGAVACAEPYWRHLDLPDGDAALTVEPLPTGGLAFTPHGAAVVRIVPLRTVRRSVLTALRQLYGLTQTEAQVAEALGRGLTPAEIAEDRGITTGTARWHVKQVLLKTDCRRQADVVALVTSLGS